MPTPKPLATRVACVAAVVLYLVARPDHYAYSPFGAGLLAFGMLPAMGATIDWVRLARPSAGDMLFVAAALAGALVVGLVPGPVTAFWHPTLLAVALGLPLRRSLVGGRVVAIDESSLTLELDTKGRLTVDRDAHDELSARSALVLAPGAMLALATRLHRSSRGDGPFRSAQVLRAGSIADVAAHVADLHQRRIRRLRLALALVALSAFAGWGAASLDLTIGSPSCLG